MGIVDGIFGLWGRRAESINPIHPRDPALRNLFGFASSRSGVNVTEDEALTYSGYWCAITVISESMAALPLPIYRRMGDDGRERATNLPLFTLLHDRPNPDMTAFDFWQTLQSHREAWGNGYATIERDGRGRVLALWPQHPNTVMPDRVRTDQRLVYVIAESNRPNRVHEQGDVLHTRGLSKDGINGLSLLRSARESIGLGIATERCGATLFGNGIILSGVVSHPGVLGDDGLKSLRESVERFHAGPDNTNRMLVLEEGAKYEKAGVAPEDAQFLQTRQYGIREMARWTKIPPHLLGDLTDAKYANIEQQSLDFVMHSLLPRCRRLEQEINWKLFDATERSSYFAEFDLKGMLRGDMKSRFESYQMAFMNGWQTINEIRRLENMNPIGEDGDVRFVPQQLQTLDRAIRAPIKIAPDETGTPPKLRSAFAGLLVVEYRRLSQKELTRIAALRKKYSSPSQLESRVSEFYADHRGAVRLAIGPVLEAWADAAGYALPGDYLDGSVARYCDAAKDRDYTDADWPLRFAEDEADRFITEMESSYAAA